MRLGGDAPYTVESGGKNFRLAIRWIDHICRQREFGRFRHADESAIIKIRPHET